MCLGRNVYLLENIAKTYCTVYGWKICTVCVQQPPYSITDAKPRGCKTPGTPDFLACVLQKVSVNDFASPLTVGQMIISWQIANFLQMSKLQHFCHNPKKEISTNEQKNCTETDVFFTISPVPSAKLQYRCAVKQIFRQQMALRLFLCSV